jgi:DNA repair protein RecO (recombination protein O)
LSSHFFTTDALVIGSMRYGEADRIVTLYTRDRGKVSVIAKGVRRTKSKVGGRLEPFSLVRMSLHSGRGSLYTVLGVETVRTFQGVRDELFRMEEGARLLNAIRHLFPAEEGSAPAFNLLVRGVARLAEAEDAAIAAGVVLATRLKLLVLLGYAPEVSQCARCGTEGPFYGFSPGLGGVVCVSCVEEAGAGPEAACFALSAGALATLRTLCQNSLAEIKDLDLDDRATAEVEQVVAQTLAFHGH